ncbi:hypothetical protein FSP39_012822 [Pinctada imbricata]|uniref:CARD domain-containing protein n=1 Tax=Pinctada imbricata TaxID=66713 RepID=A0AA88XS01_PINIB|nr:hypothetical protein FSP39_012822 [Pinctada imbricata]
MTSNYSYQAILLEKHEELQAEISLDNTLILDTLFQNEDLTESDIESIKTEKSRKDRVRTLLLLLFDRGPTVFKRFFASLKADYSHLESRLLKALEESDKETCAMTMYTICRIESTVNIRDIVDRLYSKGTLSPKEMKNILKCSNEKGWSQLKPILSKNREARDALVGAIAGKYPDLSEEYSKFPSHKFACFCKRLGIKQRTIDNIRLTSDNNISSSNRSSIASSTSSPTSSFRENEGRTSGDRGIFVEQFRGGKKIIDKELPTGRELLGENYTSDSKVLPEIKEESKVEKNVIMRTGFNRKALRKK